MKQGYRALAAAIRKGVAVLPEDWRTLHNGCGCALGAALVGTGLYVPLGRPYELYEFQAENMLSKHFGVPKSILRQASRRHLSGFEGGPRVTREQIADWLDSLEPNVAPQGCPPMPLAASGNKSAPASAAPRPTDAEVTAKFLADMTQAVAKGEVLEYATEK